MIDSLTGSCQKTTFPTMRNFCSVSFSFPTSVTTLSETGGDTMTIASASWTSSQASPCTIGTNCANIGIGATLTTTEVNQNPSLYSGTATITATYD